MMEDVGLNRLDYRIILNLSHLTVELGNSYQVHMSYTGLTMKDLLSYEPGVQKKKVAIS